MLQTIKKLLVVILLVFSILLRVHVTPTCASNNPRTNLNTGTHLSP